MDIAWSDNWSKNQLFIFIMYLCNELKLFFGNLIGKSVVDHTTYLEMYDAANRLDHPELTNFVEQRVKLKPKSINDIISILGLPATKGMTDDNVWIYIERKKINRTIFALGNKKIIKNNVAILEIDNKGILKKKEIFDLSNMNKYKFSENTTQNTYTKDTYIYGVLTSFREKINAPAKRKKVSE